MLKKEGVMGGGGLNSFLRLKGEGVLISEAAYLSGGGKLNRGFTVRATRERPCSSHNLFAVRSLAPRSPLAVKMIIVLRGQEIAA